MSRVVFVPVDERFCTRDYFLLLAEAAGLQVVTPPLEALGAKKVPPDLDRLRSLVRSLVSPGDAVIASVDMLVHGGLIPSRISRDAWTTLEERLSILADLKRRASRLYVSLCVTRTPFYDSPEEEPDYWGHYGRKLWALSRELARYRRRSSSRSSVRKAMEGIPPWIVKDFLWRRRRNYRLASRTLELVAGNEVDFLNLTLDDNTEGSLSLWEAEQHGRKVKRLGIEPNVSIHAGADESTLTLLARFLCDEVGARPAVCVEYSAPEKRRFVPPFEGRPHEEGVRSHLEAAGCAVVDRQSSDLLLFVHNPTDALDAGRQRMARTSRALYDRALTSIRVSSGIVGVAGTRFVNGSDDRFVRRLLASSLDWSKIAYAGWNTAGNTLGAAIAFMVVRYLHSLGRIHGSEEKLAGLQAVFLLEHWAFMARIRAGLLRGARRRGCKGWDLMPAELWAVHYVQSRLESFLEPVARAVGSRFSGLRVSFPWHRAFEIRIHMDRVAPAATRGRAEITSSGS